MTLTKQFEYAKRNGYAYNFDAYVMDVYNIYRDACAWCEIDPMTFDDWKASRS